MMVTLLGATGFVGKRLVARLLDAGLNVRVLVRTPDKLGDIAGKVSIVRGDFFSGEDIDAVIEGADAVMSTIGPSKGEMSAFFADSCVRAMKHLLRAVKERGTKRLIFMAGAAMPVPEEKLHFTRGVMAAFIKMVAKPAWEGKVKEMAMAFESDLNVTVIRPPMIRDLDYGDLAAHDSRIGGVFVDVNQLAAFMVDQLDGTDWIGKAPVVWTQRTARR